MLFVAEAGHVAQDGEDLVDDDAHVQAQDF
ncbi:hypothetical protein FHS29_000949 [Saccharothrix tamanrassetensis]|uniref:Uncharacterized protein n=1 Tax=Saccharothrix tamanrassetensis TaxID=1051531 RepID=A0A841CAE8_9PSEU|nr:hypothetical protein [Saccharothrix tamanrassetensis]